MSAMTCRLLLIASLIAGVGLSGCNQPPSADEMAITHLLTQSFDRPEAPLVVGPIAVSGNAALADWTQGVSGGRALLRRHDEGWRVELCAGDGIKRESTLLLAGLSPDQARTILAELDARERNEAAERLKRIGSFQGVVRIDHAAHLPPSEADQTTAPVSTPSVDDS